MLEAISLLFYKKLRFELEEVGFQFISYDPCVADRMVKGKQHTIRFHVDAILSSYIDPNVNDEYLDWANSRYGTLRYGTLMTLDFR